MSEDLTALSEAPSKVGVGQATGYQGNTNDLIAFTSAVSGLMLCGYFATNGLICCLPVLLGVAGLFLSKDATDPKRARTLSIIGIAGAAFLILLFLTCIFLYFGFVAVMAISSTGTGSLVTH